MKILPKNSNSFVTQVFLLLPTVALLVCNIVLRCDARATDCCTAPDMGTRLLCEQLSRGNALSRLAGQPQRNSRVSSPGIPGIPGSSLAADFAQVETTVYQCMNTSCICRFAGGNTNQYTGECTMPGQTSPIRKAVRKEYRCMSDSERNRYHDALNTMKSQGKYDQQAAIHSQASNEFAAHYGPAFLPWHREFCKRYEIDLRLIDQDIGLPYWDSPMDSRLPTPAHSILFTDLFLGQSGSDGYPTDGPFAKWSTTQDRRGIRRNVSEIRQPITEDGIQYTLQQDSIYNVLAYSNPNDSCWYSPSFDILEYVHGQTHLFVAGLMKSPFTSGSDPCFFNHHSFIDLIWELWRQGRQEQTDPNGVETAYPLDSAVCSDPKHFIAAPMQPFTPMQNKDGLVKNYTRDMYEYAPRPTCSASDTSCCNSPYLWCDTNNNYVCVSKIRAGGDCTGLDGQPCCYMGDCVYGTCVQRPMAPDLAPGPSGPAAPPSVAADLTPIAQQSCFNEHECCEYWNRTGQCVANSDYMNQYCKASCGKCIPQYNKSDECADRAQTCSDLAAGNGCNGTNQYWMAENCRASCERCSISKDQICSGGQGSDQAVLTMPPEANCSSTDCYNQDMCCQVWSVNCSKSGSGSSAAAGPGDGSGRSGSSLKCLCPVSCAQCTPQDYQYGECADYHSSCPNWAMLNNKTECKSNMWMLENCRKSCDSCISDYERRQTCASRNAPTTRVRRSLIEMDFQKKYYAGDNDGNYFEGVAAGGGEECFSGSLIRQIINGEFEFPENRGMPGVGVFKY